MASTAKEPERDIVYGIDDEFEGGAIFLHRSEAEWFVGVNDALASKTWGDLRRKMAEIGEDISWWNDDDPTADDDLFDAYDAPGYADGDYPPMPQQIMLSWLPEELADKYGQYPTTVLNGSFLYIDPGNADALVRELDERGYSVSRDDALVKEILLGPVDE